jgi:PKD repeat protein
MANSGKYVMVILGVLLSGIVLISSCNSVGPTACFQLDTLTDSMKVGRTILFDAQCSSDAKSYYWDFGNGQNNGTTQVAQTVYTSAAIYPVTLVVSNGSKTATISRSVTIMP